MALRGSLREFELPDIFQLIANDGKTGQLVICNKEDEAFVIFSRGAIIAAGNGLLNLQTILFKYLMDVRKYSEKELNELLYLCQGEMSLFSRELVNKRYLAKEELSLIARTGIEDLACSLFLWENGHYRFDSLESVGDYMVASVSLPSDAVTMEAMRRVDEWKRMKAVISPDSLFVPVKSNTPASPMGAETFSIMAPAEYLFSLVDGATSVEALCREVFFTEYRLYELLFDLWQKNRIMPLKMPRVPGKSPIRQKIPNSSPVAAGGIAFVIALCAALLMLGLGYVFNAKVLEKKALARQQAKSELHAYQSDNKLRIASLYYHAMFGRIPTDSRQLEEAGLIGPGDK